MGDDTLKSASAPFVKLAIEGEEFAHDRFQAFEWKSFMNGGYIIRCMVADPYLKSLHNLFVTKKYLANMRKKPTKAVFQIGWQKDGQKADPYLSYLVDVRAHGIADNAMIEFIAIDPPSWWLNAGKGDGRVFTGSVSDVIKQVIAEYAPGITSDVSKTLDNPKGKWAMMRMDPKTFIRSLLDWSCSLVDDKKKTAWITASDSDSSNSKIIIKVQAEMPYKDVGIIAITDTRSGTLHRFEFASDALITEYQSQLVTQGISSVSGKFIDKKTNPKEAVVQDDNTAGKLNARIDQEHSYNKPAGLEYSTSVMSVPELAGGEMNKKYVDYIDGRARLRFISMLPFVMRIKVTIRGDVRFTKSVELGVSTVKLQWTGVSETTFLMSSFWMLYGFHHRVRPGDWETDVYLYRFDWDAAAEKKP
jgi:hypothetical protein